MQVGFCKIHYKLYTTELRAKLEKEQTAEKKRREAFRAKVCGVWVGMNVAQLCCGYHVIVWRCGDLS